MFRAATFLGEEAQNNNNNNNKSNKTWSTQYNGQLDSIAARQP